MDLKRLCAALCLLLMVGCDKAKSQQQNGADMPTFTFYSLADSVAFTKTNIEEGKKSIILFFDATCSHCQDEVDSIGKHYDEFKDVNFYLVSMDDKPQIQKFMNKYGRVLNGKKNVVLLMDTAREFIPKFQPTKFPALFVYSEKKTLMKYFAGENKIQDIIATIL